MTQQTVYHADGVNGGNAVNFQYDQDGLLTQAGAMTIARDPANGRIAGTQVGNVTTSQTYNSAGELESYQAKFGSNVLFETHYVRDSLGRIGELTATVQGNTKVMRYGYDVAGRLEKVWRNDSLVGAYAYDANDNRLSHTTLTGMVTATHDDQDRLLTYGSVSYLYTANGELRAKVEGSDTTTYAFDSFGNLVRVELPTGETMKYIIDAQNRRVGKKVNGALVKRWLYSGQLTPAAELDSLGNLTAHFVGNLVIKNDTIYQLITDHLGSVRLVVDVNTGRVAQRLDYDEFGKVTSNSNPDFQPFAYAGGQFDDQTKLLRFGARDYDANTGRWTAKDPIGFKGEIENLYSYVGGDPINKLDVNGKQTSTSKVLTFNGRMLFIRSYEGVEIIHGDVAAISGPYGSGRLPEGEYTATNLRRRTKGGMVCPGQATGWSLDLAPTFETTRTLLRIHPDGGVEGTEGCIGVLCSASEDLYNQLRDYFEEGHTEITLYVTYAGERQ